MVVMPGFRGCPVEERERTWIQDNMEWFRGEFGDGPLLGPVFVPTREYFPPPYPDSDDDARALVTRVGGYMGVQPEVEVEFRDDLDHARKLGRLMPGASKTSGAAGQYTAAGGGRCVVAIDRANSGNPMALLAVIAHELGHVRLLGENRISGGRPDSEPLTDLLTVYLGMGIFTANAAFDFSQGPRNWRTQRIGYLTEPMFGYALACYAARRQERHPPWVKYLDTNPRVYMKHGLRYLARVSGWTAGLRPLQRYSSRAMIVRWTSEAPS
jgi:hypothetical protein